MKKRTFILFFCILVLATFVRLWQIGSVPPGLNVDEVSEGYNAYSILKTGKDRYGMFMPITFKSYGSYQPPLYTYLTVLPVYIFGSTVFAVKVVSLISGILVVIFTFFIIREFLITKNDKTSLIAALVITISPWAIFFSRMATEASVSLTLFVIGFYLLLRSIKNASFFVLACLFMGVSTHAYYSERIVSLLFLLGFVVVYRGKLLSQKKWLLWGLTVFAITQLPHLFILNSGAFTRRLNQVSYLSLSSFEANGTAFKDILFGRVMFIVREFLSQYLTYFSPRSLFFEPDDQVARSIPNLSVFYIWMIAPWVFGFRYLIKNRGNFLVKNLIILMLIAPIPAALSTDPFYTLRVFVLLWFFSIVISIGSSQLLEKIKSHFLKLFVIFILTIFSLATFYIHYFALYKHERGETVNFSSTELIKITKERADDNFVIDLSRDVALGIRFAFFREYDPTLFQLREGAPFLDKYYSSVEYEKRYDMYNIEIRPINWEGDVYKSQILVGDLLAISERQVNEHKLKLEFEIKDLANNIVLVGYSTDPKAKCLSSPISVYCKK